MDVEKSIEFILDGLARTEAGLAKTEAGLAKTEAGLARTEAGLAKTDALLRRAIKAAVREARAERQRRRELGAAFDQKMTQLAAAQLLTEEKLQGLIQSLQRGNNGHP